VVEILISKVAILILTKPDDTDAGAGISGTILNDFQNVICVTDVVLLYAGFIKILLSVTPSTGNVSNQR
jgi:hypothetical protein